MRLVALYSPLLNGMVETPDQTAYAFVELHPDYLRVVGVGAESSRHLSLGTTDPFRFLARH